MLFRATREKGQLYLPNLVAGLVKRYKFLGAPQSFKDFETDQVEFKHGIFQGSAIETLQIYNDGVAVKSNSDTDVIDAFIADLLDWTTKKLGISVFSSRSINRIYDSQLIVEAAQELLKSLSAQARLGSRVREMVLENTGLDTEYHWAGFVLAPDQIKLSSIEPSSFRFERWFSSEFELNQYFSAAPLRTKQHIDILENLERCFG